MIAAHNDPIARMETRIFILGHLSPMAIVEFNAKAPGVSGRAAGVVLLHLVADGCSADHAGSRCCRAAAAATKLIADGTADTFEAAKAAALFEARAQSPE